MKVLKTILLPFLLLFWWSIPLFAMNSTDYPVHEKLEAIDKVTIALQGRGCFFQRTEGYSGYVIDTTELEMICDVSEENEIEVLKDLQKLKGLKTEIAKVDVLDNEIKKDILKRIELLEATFKILIEDDVKQFRKMRNELINVKSHFFNQGCKIEKEDCVFNYEQSENLLIVERDCKLGAKRLELLGLKKFLFNEFDKVEIIAKSCVKYFEEINVIAGTSLDREMTLDDVKDSNQETNEETDNEQEDDLGDFVISRTPFVHELNELGLKVKCFSNNQTYINYCREVWNQVYQTLAFKDVWGSFIEENGIVSVKADYNDTVPLFYRKMGEGKYEIVISRKYPSLKALGDALKRGVKTL